MVPAMGIIVLVLLTSNLGGIGSNAGKQSGFAISSSMLPPSISAPRLDSNQALIVSDQVPTSPGTYDWQWLDSVDGSPYTNATACSTPAGVSAASGSTETCSVSTGVLHAGGSYHFKLETTKTANGSIVQTSPASPDVKVKHPLRITDRPRTGGGLIHQSAKLVVTVLLQGTGWAPYNWTWLLSVNGGPYQVATVCTQDNGTARAGEVYLNCTVPGGTLTVGDTYEFEFRITDSATLPEIVTSRPGNHPVSVV